MIEKLVKRKVTTTMIFLGICLLGIISADRLSVQLLPNIEFPKLTVITSYENAAPSEIEKLVTRNIEEAVGSVNGVISVYSESLEGLSLVTARFEWETDMDMALVETKEKVDMIKGQLPQDTEKSIVVKFDPKESPIMIYSIINKTGEFKQTRKRAEKEIQPYIERIEGVAIADITGGWKRQINVELDVSKIFSHNLSLPEVMESINMSNYNFPAGSIEKGNMEYLVRTIGEFKNITELNSVVVGRSDSGIPIYLGNISSISDSYKDRKSIIRFNGKESVALLIRKEPGKNTVDVCRKVDEEINTFKDKYRNDFQITKIYDQSEFIKSSINNVFNSAILGGIIAIFVLLFFLKEIRSPVIIATTIPISIIGTFALMYFKGITLNTMSLGGLALAVGMMVDAGIVVLESISGKIKDPGSSGIVKAVTEGTNEVFGAVVSSILTSIVVFLPIVFLSGLSGAIFGELALTISFALIFSLITSVTLIPMLSTLGTGVFREIPGVFKIVVFIKNRIFDFSDIFMEKAENLYRKLIRISLGRRKIVILMGSALLVIGAFMFTLLPTELLPKVDPGIFTIDIEAPRGTPLAESSMISMRIEKHLMSKPYIKQIFSKIGSDPDENITEKTSGRSTNNILIQVLLKKKRDMSISEIVSLLKKEIRLGENVNIDYIIKENVIASIISNRMKPLHIEVYGRDLDELKVIGSEIKTKISAIKGIKNVGSLFDKLDPELKVDIDRNKLASLGINIADVASTIKAAIYGEVVTKFRDRDDEVDIRVRLRRDDRTGKESLNNILVKTGDGNSVPIGKFSLIHEGYGSSKILRNEQSRINIITANFAGDGDGIIGRVNKILSGLKLKDGYEYKIVGEKDEIMKTFRNMRFAFILAVVLIYMLLASQFQSFINPLIIMLSIPVASFGISGSLAITGKSLNINSGMGIIMLAGVVVNNAIVLFDFIEKERLEGKNLMDAIVEAGNRRLKPILMTTFTTIFALLPISLGIGEGAELQQPMAIAVIGGLTVSTLLTLVFIPTVYSMINKDNKDYDNDSAIVT